MGLLGKETPKQYAGKSAEMPYQYAGKHPIKNPKQKHPYQKHPSTSLRAGFW